MLIKVLGTTSSEAKFGKYKKVYPVVDVNYERDGKTETKTLRGFSYPEVVKFFSDLQNFPTVVDVKSEKNDKGFWDWVKVEEADGNVVDTQKKSSPEASGAKKRNVFEERDLRIARQSSLERAITIECHNNQKGGVDPDRCVALAEQFAQWVLRPDVSVDDPSDDIPF